MVEKFDPSKKEEILKTTVELGNAGIETVNNSQKSPVEDASKKLMGILNNEREIKNTREELNKVLDKKEAENKGNKLKDPSLGLPIKLYPKKKEAFFNSLKNRAGQFLESLSRRKKEVAFSVAMTTAAMANAQHGPNNQKESYGDPTKPKTEEPRKVKEVPPGYTIDHTEGGKTFYIKKIGGAEKPAEAVKKTPVINHTKKAVSSFEKTSVRKYVTPEKKAIVKSTSPEVDIVYVEEEKKPEADPFKAFSVRKGFFFGPDQHACAIQYFPTRDTKSISVPGMLDTGNPQEYVFFQLTNGNGVPNGDFIMMKGSRVQEFFGTGNQADSQEIFSKFIAEAKAFTLEHKRDNKSVSPSEDLAKVDK